MKIRDANVNGQQNIDRIKTQNSKQQNSLKDYKYVSLKYTTQHDFVT